MDRCSDQNCEDGRMSPKPVIISIFSDYPKGSVCKICRRVHKVGINTPIVINHPILSRKVLLYMKKNGKFFFKLPRKDEILCGRRY